MEEQRQVDRGRQAGADRERAGPPGRESRLDRDVAREAPGEDRHERADDDRADLGRRERGAEDGHRDRGEERRQRQPDLERRAREDERWRAVAPQRVGDETTAVEQVPRHAHVVGGVLGRGEDDARGDQGPDDERDDDDDGGRQQVARRSSCGHPGPAQRSSPAYADRVEAQGVAVPPSAAGTLKTGGPIHDGPDVVAEDRRQRARRCRRARGRASVGSYARATASMRRSGRPASRRRPDR